MRLFFSGGSGTSCPLDPARRDLIEPQCRQVGRRGSGVGKQHELKELPECWLKIVWLIFDDMDLDGLGCACQVCVKRLFETFDRSIWKVDEQKIVVIWRCKAILVMFFSSTAG